MWCFTSVILATQEVEAGGCKFKTSLDDITKLNLNKFSVLSLAYCVFGGCLNPWFSQAGNRDSATTGIWEDLGTLFPEGYLEHNRSGVNAL